MNTNFDIKNLFQLTSLKKQEALASLNHFNALTCEYLNNYRTVCDELFMNTQKRHHLSIQRYSIVIDFFKDFKIAAMADYKFNNRLKELEDKAKKNNINNKTNETLIDNGIKLFHNDINFFVEGANKLQKETEDEIIKKILQDSIKKLGFQVKELLEKTVKYDKLLEKRELSVMKRLSEFNKSFNISIKDNENGKRCSVDTTDELITYINRLYTLIDNYNFYGKQILEYKNLAIELNHKHNECLKKALIQFSKIVGEFVGDINNTRFSKTLSHLTAIDLDPNKNEYFDINELISNKTKLEAILLGLSPTSTNITNAILNIKRPNNEHLYDLFSRKYYYFGDSYKDMTDSIVFITLDLHFAAYKKNKKGIYEKLVSTPIEFVNLEFDDIKQIIRCTYKSKGIFWDSNKTIKISMKRENIDELILSYEFAYKIIKHIRTPISQIDKDQNNFDEEMKETDSQIDKHDTTNKENDKFSEIEESYISDIEKSKNYTSNNDISEKNNSDVKYIDDQIKNENKEYLGEQYQLYNCDKEHENVRSEIINKNNDLSS